MKEEGIGTSRMRERHTHREEVPMKEEQRRNLVCPRVTSSSLPLLSYSLKKDLMEP
jgi:hypothetical protein